MVSSHDDSRQDCLSGISDRMDEQSSQLPKTGKKRTAEQAELSDTDIDSGELDAEDCELDSGAEDQLAELEECVRHIIEDQFQDQFVTVACTWLNTNAEPLLKALMTAKLDQLIETNPYAQKNVDYTSTKSMQQKNLRDPNKRLI